MKNVLKRKRMPMLCFMTLLACCLVWGYFPGQAAADVAAPPAYTAAHIPADGDGVINFTNGAAYASVITAVYLKDVSNEGDYELLAPAEWTVSGSRLTVSYRQFQEELTNGAFHDYRVKIEATGYENLEVDLKVVARAAQNIIVRVFASQADADAGTPPVYQRVLTLAELQALARHQQSITLHCGMTGMGASKASGVYLRDVLDLALADTAYAFDSGDIIKWRVTDYLRDAENQAKVKSSFDLALGDLTALDQNAWFGMSSPSYETIFADRYYFPGMFAAFNHLLDEGEIAVAVNGINRSYQYGRLLTEPLTLEGAVKVEPMLALQFSERILDRSMASSEQFPHYDGSLAALETMGVSQNDRYRFAMGQQLASDADGNLQVSAETTRFMITYNIFGIDIIKGDAPAGKAPPALKAVTGGNGVKITYRDAMDYDSALRAYPSYTNQITGVLVDGVPLDSSQYDLTVGNLIIRDSAVPAGAHTVRITANGYTDNEISFSVPARITGYEAYSDHDGEVYNQLDDEGNIVNQTDHQKFHVKVHFNGRISVTDTAALRDELDIKLNKTLTLVNADDPAAGMYATRYAVVEASADDKSLEFTLHIGFAPFSGHVAITAPNGLTTLKDLQGNLITWQNIEFFMHNGVELKTESQTAVQPKQNISASVTKKVIAPDSATRGMVHMLLLKNGQPVGTLNSFGANITAHYHDYLNLNAEKFAALIPSWYNSKFGTDYPLVVSGDQLTITAADSAEGDVIDLRIFAYPQDRDTKADKTALNALITAASAINGSHYTAETYNAMQNELYIASSMAGSIYYLQTEIDAAAEALQTAINSLQQSGPAPAAPTDLRAEPGNGQVTLTWNAVAGAASYNVYWDNGGSQVGITGTGATVTYTVTGLENDKTYEFAVTAVNEAGESDQSTVSATPGIDLTVPAKPANLTATAGNGRVTLTWSAASGADSYKVYMGTAAGEYDSTPLAAGITGTSYTASDLTNRTTYYFAVAAVNVAGESEKSNEARATPTAASHSSGSGGSGSSSNTTTATAVTVSSDQNGSATITAASLKKASEVKVTGVVDLVLDANALKTIGVEKDLVVSAVKVDNKTLSPDLQEKIGNRPVFDINITSGGEAVTDLGQGTLQISIPYVLTAEEKAEQIIVYYIDADGNLTEMSGAYYDTEAQAVVFTTNHLSRYAIGYKEPVEPIEPIKPIRFTDVPADHWAADSIDYLVEKGIIHGKTATSFAPNDNITRAEFVTILAGMAGADVKTVTVSGFSDVPADAWFAPYVDWAAQAGVSKGTGDGKFNPNAPITRQDMAAMIVRFVKDVQGTTLPAGNEAVNFADSGQIADYAADAVAMMQKAGIISGKGNNLFAPLDNATRAEAARMLATLMQILEQ